VAGGLHVATASNGHAEDVCADGHDVEKGEDMERCMSSLVRKRTMVHNGAPMKKKDIKKIAVLVRTSMPLA